MRPALYIDHVRVAPVGEQVEAGSVVRKIGTQIFGIVHSLGTTASTLILIKTGNTPLYGRVDTVQNHEIELIKCTIKHKQ